MLQVSENADGVVFAIQVQPRAAKNQVCGCHGERLKLRLTAPPVEGAANAACIALLAELLQVPKSAVTIIAGQSGRQKLVRVTGVRREQVLALLD